jgi:hypothetical protein
VTGGEKRGEKLIHVATISIRLRRRRAVFLGLATGRYWKAGAEHCHWHTDVRLPFMQISLVRGLPDRPHWFRATYMGWRGVNESPLPAFREVSR